MYACLFELVDGFELSAGLISGLTDEEARSLWQLIERTINVIHSAGVIRYDRVLRKIMWNRDNGRLVWTDFGQSNFIEDISEDQATIGKDSEVAVLYSRFEDALNAVQAAD